MRIFFSGSRRSLEPLRHGEFSSACRALGHELARRGHVAMLHTDSEKTADWHVVHGMREYAESRDVVVPLELHRTTGARKVFSDLGDHFEVKRVSHPRGGTVVDKKLGVRVGGLATADAVVLIGGSGGTEIVGDLAGHLGLPVVAIASFQGSAAQVFERLERVYQSNPAIKDRLHALHQSWEDGYAGVALEICELLGEHHTYFLSYSHEDAAYTDHVEVLLRRAGGSVNRDEQALAPGDELRGVVRSRMALSETFLGVWSAAAESSDWCRWELSEALRLAERGPRPRRVVLIAVDDTDPPHQQRQYLQVDGTTRSARVAGIASLVASESSVSSSGLSN